MFDQEFTLEALTGMGNPLKPLKEVLDFEQFRPILEPVFAKENRKSNAGRRGLDPVFMMKVMFLQRLYGLGDKQIEYQILDRMSFREFLDIKSMDDVPDEKTVWKYRDILSKNGTWDKLFDQFNKYLDSLGLIVNEGKIIDASFVLAPRQRNSRDENNQIKEGKGSELWNDKPHKKCHKDVDARWTKKRGETEYGYKDHVVVCQKTKFVRDYEVTAANVHDSKVAVRLLKRTTKVGELAWEDAGYVGTEDELRANGIVPIVCEKGYRGHPLTEKQKENNRKKSSTRSRVEHVFGFMEQTMHGLIFRGVGIVRAKANIAMTNLVYNMCRLGQVVRLHKDWITAN
ncbi:MAG: IS5 family transposase [Paludibacteraceae bacterium]|nr:IS5 family transposase [Paludibacteraceae bacterium]